MGDKDVIIVGAGMAGTVAAHLLARQGVYVTLIDSRAEFPPLFRAEKLEPDQTEMLRRFGLFDALAPRLAPIREILLAYRARVVARRSIEQYGVEYRNLVNPLRESLPPGVAFKLGKVQHVDADPDRPKVTLATGEEIAARLVIVAGGTGGGIAKDLGIEKRPSHSELSLALGFNLVRTDGRPFSFDAVTYRPESVSDRVGYLTLFRFPEAMRANLFVYWSPKDPQTRQFLQEPTQQLARLLPGLRAVIGDYDVEGRVEACAVELFKTQMPAQPGVILLADAFQSVCPTTGMGLSKVLTDADVLCHDCAPRWLQTPGMGVEKIQEFYLSPRKQAVDRAAWDSAIMGRQLVIGASPLLWARRQVGMWCWKHSDNRAVAAITDVLRQGQAALTR
jgi:2-polyprenyl-6-methoxyphenol hydroxylase-like FAD-dependent oxidoreductase